MTTTPLPAEVYASVTALAQWLCPESADGGRVRIVIELPGPDGWEQVSEIVRPIGSTSQTKLLGEKARLALEFLKKQPPGEVVKRRTLAAELELDPEGGHFNEVVKELKAANLIEVQRGAIGGYSLRPSTSGE